MIPSTKLAALTIAASIAAAGHELLTPRNRATLPQQIASVFATFALQS